jgi:hypothetical protein
VKLFHQIVFVGSIGFAGYWTFRVIGGVVAHRICINMYCAHLWVMHEGFFPIAFLYSLFAVIGFSLAWVAYGRLSDQTNASPQ